MDFLEEVYPLSLPLLTNQNQKNHNWDQNSKNLKNTQVMWVQQKSFISRVWNQNRSTSVHLKKKKNLLMTTPENWRQKCAKIGLPQVNVNSVINAHLLMEGSNSKERYIYIQITRQNHVRNSSLKEFAAMEIDANTSTLQHNFLRKDKRIFSKKYILENCSLMFLRDSLSSSNNSIFLIGWVVLLIFLESFILTFYLRIIRSLVLI